MFSFYLNRSSLAFRIVVAVVSAILIPNEYDPGPGVFAIVELSLGFLDKKGPYPLVLTFY